MNIKLLIGKSFYSRMQLWFFINHTTTSLLFSINYNRVTKAWYDKKAGFSEDQNLETYGVTHWMPMPAAPAVRIINS
ncbi:DUF551 domain-containing protein [Limnobaculum zhutongyuii]|uniref:DUF551 domain-containing protein n=1 Tax=Limnobaculum zhutongyuii TaxID=2498113 RepID=A0A411WIU5_9GAMM|nr:DUF551 domain-containing protein [Limnobaculum zhutongyuii]TQS87242.1 DUF551 domain-containing protein [Limnobaculum zhutongyuii]